MIILIDKDKIETYILPSLVPVSDRTPPSQRLQRSVSRAIVLVHHVWRCWEREFRSETGTSGGTCQAFASATSFYIHPFGTCSNSGIVSRKDAQLEVATTTITSPPLAQVFSIGASIPKGKEYQPPSNLNKAQVPATV